jgi:hypothetical protein
MKKGLLIAAMAFCMYAMQAQVTQLNSNQSLSPAIQLSNSKALLLSDVDNSIWVTDGSATGTKKISGNITYNGEGGGMLTAIYLSWYNCIYRY